MEELNNLLNESIFITLICFVFLVSSSNKLNCYKEKIVNPPQFFPVLVLIAFSIFFLFFAFVSKQIFFMIPVIITSVMSIIIQDNQIKKLKEIYQYQQTKEYVIKNIKTKSDEFKKSHHFKGPKIFGKTSIGKIYFYCFASGLEKEKGILLLVGLFNHKYNFSQEAYDNQGNKIYISTHIDETISSYRESYRDSDQKITNQKGDVIGTIEGKTHYETHYQTEYTESFAMSLPLESIKNIGSEYQIKLYGYKDVVVDIPSWYIQAFVEGIKNKPEFNKIKWQ